MALSVMGVVLFGTVCLISTKFGGVQASVFTNFQIPLKEKKNTETAKRLDSLTERIEKVSSENKEAIKNMTQQVNAMKDMVSSLASGHAPEKSEQQKQIESVMNKTETAAKEVEELKGSLDTVRTEADQSKAKVLAMEQIVQGISNKVDTTKNHIDQYLGEVSGQVADVKEAIQEQQKKTQEQCLHAEHQNAVLLDTLPVSTVFDTLTFESSDQSTWTWEGAKAIDGNRNPHLTEGSCTKTAPNDKAPWWQGNLKAECEVHRFILTNRGDCCPGRLRHFKIEGFVDDPIVNEDAKPQLCKEVDAVKVAVATIECDAPITAKHVRITKHTAEQLSLCEVDVEGFTLPKKPKGLAIQSSVASSSSGAMMATDNDPDTCSETRSESGRESWWQVDLTDALKVKTVSIKNRKDDKYICLSNFKVSLYVSLPSTCSDVPTHVCASFEDIVAKGEVVTLTCDPPAIGRYLRITKKDGGVLSLCHVNITTGT